MRSFNKIFVSSTCCYATILHHYNTVTQMKKINSVSNQNSSFILAKSLEHRLENFFSYVGIERRYWIVH